MLTVPFRTRRAEGHLLAINAHPDPRPERFCAALCSAYADGARKAGWRVIESPVTAKDIASGDALAWADRLALFFPLWLDSAPGLLRDCLGRWQKLSDLRPGLFAGKRLKMIVTMALPALVYRPLLRGEALLGPLAATEVEAARPLLIGAVSELSVPQRERWLQWLLEEGRAIS